MIPKKFSGFSILLILALLISSFAVVMPAAPAQAQVTAITITYPSSGSPVSINPGTTISVTYNLIGDGTTAQSWIYITNGSTYSTGNIITAYQDPTTRTSATSPGTICVVTSVPIPSNATVGQYNVFVVDMTGPIIGESASSVNITSSAFSDNITSPTTALPYTASASGSVPVSFYDTGTAGSDQYTIQVSTGTSLNSGTVIGAASGTATRSPVGTPTLTSVPISGGVVGQSYNVILSVGSLAIVYQSNAVTIGSSAGSVVINSPTNSVPWTTHSNGYVPVQCTVTGTSGIITIQIGNGSSNNQGYLQTTAVSGQYTYSVPMYSYASPGTYNVYAGVGTTSATPIMSSVIVSNAFPTVNTPTSPSAGAGWSTINTGIQNPLAFSFTSQTTSNTVLVEVSLTSSTSGYTSINGYLTQPIPTGAGAFSGTSYSGYILPAASSGGNPIYVGAQSPSMYIRITVTDANGMTAPSPYVFGPYTMTSSAPAAAVSYSTGIGYACINTSGGLVLNTGQAGTQIVGSVSIPSAAGYYEIGLFANGQTGTPTTILTGGFQQATNGTYGTWTSTTFNINYNWTVPTTVRGSSCYIGICGKDNNSIIGPWAYTTVPFRIFDNIKPNANITNPILWPTSNSVHYSGASDNFTWIQTDNVPGNLSALFWFTVNGLMYQYNAPAQQQGLASTTWTVPLITSGNSVTTTLYENITDQENPANTLTITGPSFTIVVGQPPTVTAISSPSCGATWQVGSTQTLTWTQSDPSSTSARLSDNISIAGGGSSHAPVVIYTFSGMGLNSVSQTIAVPDPASLGFTPTNGSGTSATYSCTLLIQAWNPISGQQSATYTLPCTISIIAATSAVYTSPAIPLYYGWNLVSLPLVPTNPSIQSVLGSATSYISAVYSYSGGGVNGGTASVWSPGNPANLTQMTDKYAYWIYITPTSSYPAGTYATSFTFQGRPSNVPPVAPPTYSFPTVGWYMVGFKSTDGAVLNGGTPTTAHHVSDYFGSPTNGSTQVYSTPITGFNPQTQTFTSLPYESSPTSASLLTVGQGYWVYYNVANSVLTPPSD